MVSKNISGVFSLVKNTKMKIPIKKVIQEIVMMLFLFMAEILVQKYLKLKVIKIFSYRMPNFRFRKVKNKTTGNPMVFERLILVSYFIAPTMVTAS